MALSHNKSSPAYIQLMDKFKNNITTGEWAVGNRIPTVTQLENSLPFSRMTIYKALQELGRNGYLETRGKGGTIVCQKNCPKNIALIYQLDFDCPSHAQFTHSIIKQIETELVVAGNRSVSIDSSPKMLDETGSTLTKRLRDENINAIISVMSKLPSWRKNINWSNDLPCINIGIDSTEHQIYYDYMDGLAKGFELAKKTMRKNYALISNLPPHKTALTKLLHDHSFTVNNDMLITDYTKYDEQYGYDSLCKIFDSQNKPDVVLISDDIITKGASQATLKLGLNVPDDIMLICLSANKSIERFYPCPISQIIYDPADLAKASITLLNDIFSNEKPARKNVKIMSCGEKVSE
jgi:DNA-binding LacI/PurR family transcriptional regulator